MRMITGFLPATSGSIKVCGNSVHKEPIAVKEKIGYVPEGAPLYGEMTVISFLKFISSIRKIKKENPNAKILVTGCSAQIDPYKWLEMEEVSNVIGNSEKTKKEFWKNFSLNKQNELITSDIMSVSKDETDFSGLTHQNSRYFLQIQNGCDHRCTFCIIPYGRGNSRSVSIKKILGLGKV